MKTRTQTISISKDLYNYLLGQKSADCKTFEEVLWRLIKFEEEKDGTNQ
jgi:predicted CopG family antitoxin